VIIHPNYIPGVVHVNNVAMVIASNNTLDDSFTSLLTISINPNFMHNLVGWGGAFLEPEMEQVQIFGPEFWNRNSNQTYYSIHKTNARPCDAFMGSPLMAGSFFTGFLTNNQVCSLTSSGFMLTYHTVTDYAEFIEEALTEESAANDFPNFVANIVTISEYDNNVPVIRCSGTIISEQHVLTTAECASTDQTIAIHSAFNNSENGTEIGYEKDVKITIHPDYSDGKLSHNNLAIIKVRIFFFENK
jgi:hypothetical protein